MRTDPNLGLTYDWQLGENVKPEMDANLAKLGSLVFLSVVSRSMFPLPDSPAEGTRFIDPSTGQVKVFLQGQYVSYDPEDGWIARVADDNELVIYKQGIGWDIVAPQKEILLDENFNTLYSDDYNVLEAAQ